MIDGPIFWTATADAAEVVTYTGVAGNRIEFAYGQGSALDITTDAGRTWWQTFFDELVLDVTDQNGRLVAIVQEQTNSRGTLAVTWVYTSKDGGRHWQYSDRLGGF